METPQTSEKTSQPVAPEHAKKRSSVIRWALILGIAIVINLFLTYLVRVVYDAPLYEAFCPERQVNELIETREACLQVGGQWNENVTPRFEPGAPEVRGYCDPDYTCRNIFEEALSVYNRNVFVVFVLAGILLLIGSVYLAAVETISLGLSLGGVLALIIGSIIYWSDMNDVLRLAVLALALAGLLYVAWKKFKE